MRPAGLHLCGLCSLSAPGRRGAADGGSARAASDTRAFSLLTEEGLGSTRTQRGAGEWPASLFLQGRAWGWGRRELPCAGRVPTASPHRAGEKITPGVTIPAPPPPCLTSSEHVQPRLPLPLPPLPRGNRLEER